MIRITYRKTLLIYMMIVIAVVMASCGEGQTNSDGSSYEETGYAMGTVVNQTIYSEDIEVSKEIAQKNIDILTETEDTLISWRSDSSDIAKINRNAEKNKPTQVSEKTGRYIETALDIAKKSKGAFDPSIGKLTRLWDFDDAKNVVPDDGQIQKLLKTIDYKNIKVEDKEITIKKGSDIDLGAIGKGIGCDEISTYLKNDTNVKGALINVGGSSIVTYGEKDTDQPWKVAVTDPRDKDGYLGVLELKGTNQISTSGDYEKYFEEDGKRYHHILNPSTGYPADSGLISVTIVSNNGAVSDALSTACFVLGKDEALKILKSYDAEAVFVDTDKKVYVTEGLEDKFELTADGYSEDNI